MRSGTGKSRLLVGTSPEEGSIYTKYQDLVSKAQPSLGRDVLFMGCASNGGLTVGHQVSQEWCRFTKSLLWKWQ